MRNPHTRPVDPMKKLRRLERKHAELEKQVEELEARTHLSPTEEMEKQRLKKKKLATKDELQTVRRELGIHDESDGREAYRHES